MSPSPAPEPAGSDPIRSIFQEHGLPYTVQRRAVLESLAARRDHPTAEDVYEDVADEFPGLSRATVYRSLETLVTLGLATRIAHPGSAARYDRRTDRHHHLVCEECGQVEDLEDELLKHRISLPARHRSGFRPRDFSIQVVGVCRDCGSAR